MTISHVLAPWTTLRGDNASQVVRQTECEWLALDGFRDLTAWIHVSQAAASATNTISLETSPTEDESFFQTLTSTSVGTSGLYVAISRGKTAAVPLARFVRWVFTTTSTSWTLTFRIIVCVNPTVPTFSMMKGNEVFTNPALGGG